MGTSQSHTSQGLLALKSFTLPTQSGHFPQQSSLPYCQPSSPFATGRGGGNGKRLFLPNITEPSLATWHPYKAHYDFQAEPPSFLRLQMTKNGANYWIFETPWPHQHSLPPIQSGSFHDVCTKCSCKYPQWLNNKKSSNKHKIKMGCLGFRNAQNLLPPPNHLGAPTCITSN